MQIDTRLAEIRAGIETAVNGVSTVDEVRRVVEGVIYGTKKDKEAGRTFWEYYRAWVSGSGDRVKRATIKVVERLMGRRDGWDGIDEAWHGRLMKRMDAEGYTENYKSTVTKHIRGVLLSAYRDGLYKKDGEWMKMRKRWETADTIYLTQDEVDRLWGMELQGPHAKARDLFLLGVYSAARYQNYSQFTLGNLRNGNLDFVQMKTGERVTIPASPKIREILERNGGKAPVMSNQKLNVYIKEVCEMAGMTEPVEIRHHRGGRYDIETVRRCDLVTTHTARRTGATLLYLSGVPVRLCRFLTGHSSDEMFMRYIKVRREEAADRLRDNPFFK